LVWSAGLDWSFRSIKSAGRRSLRWVRRGEFSGETRHQHVSTRCLHNKTAISRSPILPFLPSFPRLVGSSIQSQNPPFPHSPTQKFPLPPHHFPLPSIRIFPKQQRTQRRAVAGNAGEEPLEEFVFDGNNPRGSIGVGDGFLATITAERNRLAHRDVEPPGDVFARGDGGSPQAFLPNLDHVQAQLGSGSVFDEVGDLPEREARSPVCQRPGSA